MMLLLMLSGVPVVITFLLVDLVGAYLFMGGEAGLGQLILNIRESLTSFSLLPVPLFILMGEVMFRSGVGFKAIEVVDHWIGRVPGRLSLVAIMSGTLLAAVSGSTLASAALLGEILLPEMKKRGYKHEMSIGPILGTGGLAMLIPPSALAIVLAALCDISIGGLLIAGIVPGIMIATFMATYVIVRCVLQPELAPPYHVESVSFRRKVRDTVVHVMPLGIIIFLVVGLIFLGVATPSEAAALGALGTFMVGLLCGRMNYRVLSESIMGTVKLTSMIFLIIVGSMTFSQILAFSGASSGLIQVITSLDLPPFMILLLMQLMLMCLGCFMDNLSMVMIAIPIYMPIAHALHFNPMWFALLMLINMDIGNITPPFGLLLFVMKGIAPPGTTMMQVYKSGFPFLMCEVLTLALIMVFPAIGLFLPGLLR
jgi:tripartite ATP-independent transporter DctM subunit